MTASAGIVAHNIRGSAAGSATACGRAPTTVKSNGVPRHSVLGITAITTARVNVPNDRPANVGTGGFVLGYYTHGGTVDLAIYKMHPYHTQ
jgi:hypothetical protein